MLNPPPDYAPSLSLDPIQPLRPLEYPAEVGAVERAKPPDSEIYLVGGVVRDALLGVPSHDIDLVTPGDGLHTARHMADTLQGAYYPVDPERRTGRIVLQKGDQTTIVDVASYRGDDLLADLRGRDFTINAIASPLESPDVVIDPLDGQGDLLQRKTLRLASQNSISSDPIRALRAVRMSLKFQLRMQSETTQAVRKTAPSLMNEVGNLAQPERVRDEFFKLLQSREPAASLRLLDTLGMLNAVVPSPLPSDTSELISTVEHLSTLFVIISPQRDDNTASDLIHGVAVMVLDRWRMQLQEHLERLFADGRAYTTLALLAAITPGTLANPGEVWGEHMRLSKAEGQIIQRIVHSQQSIPTVPPVDARQIHRYYRQVEEPGVTGVLLMLARYLASEPLTTLDPVQWTTLLDEVASPLLDAFFRRHQQIVSPPPLLTGKDLIKHIEVKPGPLVGEILDRLLEEQAAGEVTTKEEALAFASRLKKD